MEWWSGGGEIPFRLCSISPSSAGNAAQSLSTRADRSGLYLTLTHLHLRVWLHPTWISPRRKPSPPWPFPRGLNNHLPSHGIIPEPSDALATAVPGIRVTRRFHSDPMVNSSPAGELGPDNRTEQYISEGD
jgi:hypothetical protein